MKSILVKILCLSLVLGMALSLASIASASDLLTYDEAIERLGSISLTDKDELDLIYNSFQAIGSRYFAPQYMYLTATLLELSSNENVDFDRLEIALTILKSNSVFVSEYMADESLVYLPLDSLLIYVQARKYEAEGNFEEAYEAYVSCQILDSIDRAVSIHLAMTQISIPKYTKSQIGNLTLMVKSASAIYVSWDELALDDNSYFYTVSFQPIGAQTFETRTTIMKDMLINYLEPNTTYLVTVGTDEGNSVSGNITLPASLSTTEAIRLNKLEFGDRPAVAFGLNYAVAILSNGRVIATSGTNDYGQCNVEDWQDIVQVAAGNYHTLGLHSDGTVIAVGSNEHGQCEVDEWRNVVQIVAYYNFSIGITAEETLLVCGDDWIKKYYDPTKGIKYISSNGYAVIYNDGTGFYINADNEVDQIISQWDDLAEICSNASGECIALTNQGTLLSAGLDAPLIGWDNIIHIDSDGPFFFGLSSDGIMHEYGYKEWYSGYISTFRNYYFDRWQGGRQTVLGFVASSGLLVVLEDGSVEVSGDTFVEYRIREEWNDIEIAPMQ